MKYYFFLFFFVFVVFLNFNFLNIKTKLLPFKFGSFFEKKEIISTNKDLENKEGKVATTIVIGSGPAGCAAALYAARLGGKVIVISGDMPGGQLTKTTDIENWPGIMPINGYELMQIAMKQSETYGANFISSKVEKIEKDGNLFSITLDDGDKYYSYSIILATGSSPKKLECKGEEEYWSKGVSTCAICDAPFYKNKNVIVIGGGDRACEEALQLTDYANSVSMFVRSDKMRASNIMKKRVENSNKIKILYNTSVKEIRGDGSSVKTVLIKMKDGELNVEKEIEIDGIFVAIGHSPNNEIIKGLVKLSKEGYVICKGRSQETNLAGVFAAGDIEGNEYKQAGSAAGDGVKAGIDSYRYLQEIGVTSDFILNNENYWFKKGVTKKDSDLECDGGVCKINLKKKDKNKQEEELKKEANHRIIKLNSLKEYLDLLENKKNCDHKYLIKLSTKYCSACKALEKNLIDFLDLTKSNIEIYSIDLDLAEGASTYKDFKSITSVPITYLMLGEKKVKEKTGMMSEKEIKEFTEFNIPTA